MTLFNSRTFLTELQSFGQNLLGDLLKTFNPDDFLEIDHACFRVRDLASYRAYKELLASIGTLLSETSVNGRPIASYKLAKTVPLSSNFRIGVVELPAPKIGAPYSEGFEHIEVVTRGVLEHLIDKYPHLTFTKKNLDASINRDISFTFKSGLVKFHEKSLEAIIAEELGSL